MSESIDIDERETIKTRICEIDPAERAVAASAILLEAGDEFGTRVRYGGHLIDIGGHLGDIEVLDVGAREMASLLELEDPGLGRLRPRIQYNLANAHATRFLFRVFTRICG